MAVSLLVIVAVTAACTRKNPQTGAQSSTLSPSAAPASYIGRLGVGVSTASRTCVAIQNANLASGTAVTIVSPTLPQSFLQGEIGATSQAPCPIAKDLDPSLTSYDLHVTGTPPQKLMPLIVALSPAAAFSTDNNLVKADLDQNGKTEFFRACGANDGLALTLWSGPPTTSSVLWRGAYYDPANAAAAPPCTAKETAGP